MLHRKSLRGEPNLAVDLWSQYQEIQAEFSRYSYLIVDNFGTDFRRPILVYDADTQLSEYLISKACCIVCCEVTIFVFVQRADEAIKAGFHDKLYVTFITENKERNEDKNPNGVRRLSPRELHISSQNVKTHVSLSALEA